LDRETTGNGYHPGEIQDFDYQISVDLPGFSAMIIKPDQVTIKRKRSKKR
jgi:1,4-alpha-glucan branching enzyme